MTSGTASPSNIEAFPNTTNTAQHLSLRIIVTKHSGNSHKWGVMEVIAQEVVGDDFKDFYQTGRRWGDTITRRKLIYDKLPNLFSMSSILE